MNEGAGGGQGEGERKRGEEKRSLSLYQEDQEFDFVGVFLTNVITRDQFDSIKTFTLFYCVPPD